MEFRLRQLDDRVRGVGIILFLLFLSNCGIVYALIEIAKGLSAACK